MVSLETKEPGDKLLPLSNLRGVFREEIPCTKFTAKITTKISWRDVIDTRLGYGILGNLELKSQIAELEKWDAEESSVCSRGQWSAVGSRMWNKKWRLFGVLFWGEKAKRGLAIVVCRSTMGSVAKEIICNDRIIVLKLKAESESVLIFQVYMSTSE